MTEDEMFMSEALREARAAADCGEIPIGAVVVRDGAVIARGSNDRSLSAAPFGHAEMVAIERACKALGSWRLDGCELFVTLEPCPMCAGAITQTRIARLVYGASDPKAGACGTLFDIPRDRRLPHRTETVRGPLAAECAKLLQEFFIAKRSRR